MFNYSIQNGFIFFCDPNMAVHRNSSYLYTITLMVSGINIVLSITAILGNALILVALHKESSLNPPSKLFLRCLAFSDICVGLLVQPVTVVSLLSAVYHRWNLCRVVEVLWHSLSVAMAGFSLSIMTAMSVDRLLALLLSIRYRHVVTMKRARLLLVLFLLLSVVDCALQFMDFFAFLVYSVVAWGLWLLTSIHCYVRIFLAVRNHIQAQVTPQGDQNEMSPLNVSRYKRTVCTALWVFAALIVCYAPMGFVLIVATTVSAVNGPLAALYFFTITLVYLNSSLNPILYFWRIRELRHAMKEILRNLLVPRNVQAEGQIN